MSYKCPNCKVELEHNDTFGNLAFILGKGGAKKGDIYWCPNEKCEESHFFVLEGEDELREGYPC